MYRELQEKFLRELVPAERLFFLKKARECITVEGYVAGEDLFYYCYFLTLRERFHGVNGQGGEGCLRFLLVEGRREVEDAIALYKEKLEKSKLPLPDIRDVKYIKYFTA